ncbi:MAG: protein kinase, partial [Candidatus Marsarchaeota archaeon]|nr:protein kinase [Candidatus Marsarchaeota archaeon]
MRRADEARNYRIEPAIPIIRQGQDPITPILKRACPWMTIRNIFAEQSFGAGQWPTQGWKIHVSATAMNAREVLGRALPILLEFGVRFKVVKSIPRLLDLNSGEYGLSQIGKFITAYPSDDKQSIDLAHALDRATFGLAGPFVPTDKVVRKGGIVHYRYGGFWPAVSANDGSLDSTIFDDQYRLIVDHRLPYYIDHPLGIPDPFHPQSITDPESSDSGAFASRFVILEAFSRGTWGRAYKAIDLNSEPPRLCVLKEFWHDVAMDIFGRDARDHAFLEASILHEMGSNRILPEYYDCLEVDGNVYLVMEYIDGETLDQIAARRWRNGDRFGPGELTEIGQELATAVHVLNENGLILRDIKPSNVIMCVDGRLRIIDAAISYRPGIDIGPPLGVGTKGFMAPEQARLAPPLPTHDVFGWAMTMRFLATGSNPWHVTPQGRLVAKHIGPIRRSRPDLSEQFGTLLNRSSNVVSDRRPGSLGIVLRELECLKGNDYKPSIFEKS